MTASNHRPAPSDRLRAFLSHAPSGSAKALAILSSAESLTDWLAERLVRLASKNGKLYAKPFVSALHTCGFVVERNGEWHFSSSERSYLVHSLLQNKLLYGAAHNELLALTQNYTQRSSEFDLPYYLSLPAAVAYHSTALNPEKSYLYSAAYSADPSLTWLGAQLAKEQIEIGLIQKADIAASFLIGMSQYREGKKNDALQILKSIAVSDEVRLEVAISAHLYGQSIRHHDPVAAIALLQKSLVLLESLDDRFGQAQVMHTLGQALWRIDSKSAETYLRKSVEIGLEIGRQQHVSDVYHTLGQVLWKTQKKEAEQLLRMSIDIDSENGNQSGLAKVLHTLGQKLRSSNPKDAEAFLRQSLEIERQVGSRYGQAQVLHTLAQHLLSSDEREAERLLRESLALGQVTNNMRHQAIVCLTLGKLLQAKNPVEAIQFFKRSLQLNQVMESREGERLVLREMRRLGLIKI
ncbi:hypothetical protein [Comamonas terrigena]|uniref:hypothetical protein n=1 Tax=Comamonas terrigena TaxID=32013 RepID=UPI0024498882|nr:hypothetical protein [Comamonas terrigena]MDH1701852.1 hypothetical protein [Comamonas terrigena]